MQHSHDFRFRQALSLEGLIDIADANRAIGEAIQDCVNSGTDPLTCPAIKLLSRHLRRIAEGGGAGAEKEDLPLRDACLQALEVQSQIAELAAIMKCRSWRTDSGKDAFHRAGARALREICLELNIDRSGYDIRHSRGGPGISGEIVLHTDWLWLRVAHPFIEGEEVLYRAVQGRDDFNGSKGRYASVHDLLEPTRFASRLKEELHCASLPS